MESTYKLLEYLCFFILTFNDHVTVSLKQHGAYLDSDSYKKFDNIGIQQCSKRCYAETDCQSINFSLTKYTCTLSFYNTQQKQLVSDSEYVYVDRYDMAEHFSAPVNCSERGVLLNMHDDSSYCYRTGCSSRLKWESNPNVTVIASDTHTGCSVKKASLDYGDAAIFGSGWCALSDISYQSSYIQFEFNNTYKITSVVTQGRADIDQWLTAYKIQSSDDAVQWTQIGNDYIGNSDRDTHVTNVLSTPVKTKYMRILPVSFDGHPSFRFDLIGCFAI